MANRRPKKKLQKSSGATPTEQNVRYQQTLVHRVVDDLPTEILHRILRRVAVLSSVTHAQEVKVNFSRVLTSLALVCRRWRDVISDPRWRAGYFKQLMAIDPMFRYRSEAKPVRVAGVGCRVMAMCVLGDELFVLRGQQKDIEVYSMDALDVTRKLRTYRSPQLRLLRTIALTADILTHFVTLQSCDVNNSLYVGIKNFQNCSVSRLSPNDGRVLANWTSVVNGLCTMSVDVRTGRVLASVSDDDDRRLMIYSEDGQLTRSIDVSGLLPVDPFCCFQCVAVRSEADTVAESSFMLFYHSSPFVPEAKTITHFRISSTDDKIFGAKTRDTNRYSTHRMSDNHGGALVLECTAADSDLHLGLHRPPSACFRPHRVWLGRGSVAVTEHWRACLDRTRDRLLVWMSRSTSGRHAKLAVYDLRRGVDVNVSRPSTMFGKKKRL